LSWHSHCIAHSIVIFSVLLELHHHQHLFLHSLKIIIMIFILLLLLNVSVDKERKLQPNGGIKNIGRENETPLFHERKSIICVSWTSFSHNWKTFFFMIGDSQSIMWISHPVTWEPENFIFEFRLLPNLCYLISSQCPLKHSLLSCLKMKSSEYDKKTNLRYQSRFSFSQEYQSSFFMCINDRVERQKENSQLEIMVWGTLITNCVPTKTMPHSYHQLI
jgi:hypothetical protein